MSTYRVQAHNSAHDSENKIHDDTVARSYGFTGALVPGVDVYAYMMHLPVARWGREFLERGAAECKFTSPVYDGESVEVTGGDDQGAIEVRSQGKLCASGSAWLAAGDITLEHSPEVEAPSLEHRPAASTSTLAVDRWLGTQTMHASAEFM